MADVVTTVIPESFEEIASTAQRVKGLLGRVQIDVANGTYAPSKTWPYIDASHFDALLEENEGLPFWDTLDYEVDLLINEPEKEIDKWIHAGVAAAIVHVESTDKMQEIIEKLKEVNVEVGLGIKPSTPNDELEKYIAQADFVQCMGNDEIGYHGVALDPSVYDKVRDIRAKHPTMPIAVDIGVNEETAPKLVEAGVTKLVSGSAILGSVNVGETVRFFKSL